MSFYQSIMTFTFHNKAQSTDRPRSDAVVSEKADPVSEPVAQTQDIIVQRADVIAEPAAQVEDSTKPDVEPEAETGDGFAQLAHPSDEPVVDASSAVVFQDPQTEEVVTEPIVTDDTPVVGNEANGLAQSTESSTAPKGETEPVLEPGSQAETAETVEIADEAKPEPEIASDKAQSTGEAEPAPTDPVPLVEAPSAAETTEAIPVHDTEAVEPSEIIGQDAALDPSTADRTDIVVGNQEAPAHPSVPEALFASEESGISQHLDENIETQGANQVEGSTDVHPTAVVDSNESQIVEPTEGQTVPAVDNSKTEFPSENVETVVTPTLSSNIPIPEETALSNPTQAGDNAPSVESPSDEVQPSLAAKDTPTPDPSDLATNTAVHADSISHEGSSANATAEAPLQSVQADFAVPEQPSPSTQHISDPTIATAESASGSFPPTIEDTTPSVKGVVDTQDTIPSDHYDISDMKVESVQEPMVVATVEPEGTTSVELESSITKNLTVQVPEVEETHPADTQTVVEADQEPPTNDAPALISEPTARVVPTTEHQDTVPAETEPSESAIDSQGADSEAPTLSEKNIEGTSEPAAVGGAHDSTQLDTISTVANPEHILPEDTSAPIPEAEEVTQSIETHQEEPPTKDDAAPTNTEPISELEAHATAATEYQDTAHLPSATVDDQPPAAEDSIDSLRADAEAPVVSDRDGGVIEVENAGQAYDSSVQPGSFSNVEPAVQPEESAPEPPVEPPVATDTQPVPFDNVEAEGRATLEDIPISPDVEAKDLDPGINGDNAEAADGTTLEDQPVDMDDTKVVFNEQPESNVAPIDGASVPELPSAINETPEQVNPNCKLSVIPILYFHLL